MASPMARIKTWMPPVLKLNGNANAEIRRDVI